MGPLQFNSIQYVQYKSYHSLTIEEMLQTASYPFLRLPLRTYYTWVITMVAKIYDKNTVLERYSPPFNIFTKSLIASSIFKKFCSFYIHVGKIRFWLRCYPQKLSRKTILLLSCNKTFFFLKLVRCNLCT